jgi:hypothetical protein
VTRTYLEGRLRALRREGDRPGLPPEERERIWTETERAARAVAAYLDRSIIDPRTQVEAILAGRA